MNCERCKEKREELAQSWVYKPAVAVLDALLPLDKPSFIRIALPLLIGWMKGKPRYFPKVKWASNDFTYDVFRAYELIFGKEYGVKLASSGEVVEDGMSPTGFRVRNKKFYTLEARIADWEGSLRYDIKAMYGKLKEHKIFQIPELAYGIAVMLALISKASFGLMPMVMGAVAVGLINDGSTLTFNAGGTGAVLISAMADGSGTSLTVTYGGVTMPPTVTVLSRCWGGAGSGIYNNSLTNPPSGSNTLSIGAGYQTYTGIDSTSSTSGVNAATITACGTGATSVATTTTRAGCMIGGFTNGGALPSLATNAVLDTIDYHSGALNYILHSSTPFSAQTVTSVLSNSASGVGYQVAVQPPAPAIVTGGFFMQMMQS